MLRQLQLAMRNPVCHRTCIKVRLELDSPKLVSCQAEAPPLGGGVIRPAARRGTRPLHHIMPASPPGHQSATTDPLRRRQPQESARRPVTACHQSVTCAAYISIRSYGAHIRLRYTWSETYLGHLWSSGYDVSLTR